MDESLFGPGSFLGGLLGLNKSGGGDGAPSFGSLGGSTGPDANNGMPMSGVGPGAPGAAPGGGLWDTLKAKFGQQGPNARALGMQQIMGALQPKLQPAPQFAQLQQQRTPVAAPPMPPNPMQGIPGQPGMIPGMPGMPPVA